MYSWIDRTSEKNGYVCKICIMKLQKKKKIPQRQTLHIKENSCYESLKFHRFFRKLELVEE